MFLNDQFRPITDTVGLFEAPAESIARDYYNWMSEILGSESDFMIHHIPASPFTDHLRSLCPLVKVGITRALFQPVGSGWTACFTNGWRGTDMSSIVPMLSSRLGCRALRVTSTPDLHSGTSRRFGARILEHYAGSRAPSRVISVVNDGGKWVHVLFGNPLTEEEPTYMEARMVRDRFTPTQLRSLLARLVPGVWQMDTDVVAAFLVTRPKAPAATFEAVQLEQVQANIPSYGF